jgi:NTE family protein
MLLLLSGTPPFFPLQADAITVVYPDTLTAPFNRHLVIPSMRPARKTVGIALSGGGANGIAQIGVLKALEEENVPVDFIAGTSIGALVGGLYSSGYTASELEQLARSFPWEEMISLADDAPRSNIYLEQKKIRDRATVSIRFSKFRLVVPKSLSSAQKLTKTVDLLVLNAPYHTTYSFSDLPISFRAVTTDLVSGKRVTISSGALSEAMRASSTIPILNEPIEVEGMKLADGGLVANLPVDELDRLQAGYKIAVDTHGNMYTEGKDLDIPWKAADQAMTILTRLQYPQQLEKADIVITPDLAGHTATDFSDVEKLLESGYAKGKLLAETIKRSIRSDIPNDHDISRHSKTIRSVPDSPDYAEQMRIASGIIRSASRLRQCLSELLATDLFSSVYAEFDPQKGQTVFVLSPLPRITGIELAGGPERIVSAEDLERTFRPLTGTLYTNAVATRSLEQLIRLYRKKGYCLVGITDASVREKKLRISLSSGKIDTITIEQDRNITRTTPILRETAIDTSRAVEIRKAEQSIDNLYGVGVFNRVSLRTETSQPSGRGTADNLTIRLDEKPSSVLRLGLRYDETSNSQLLVDYRNENLNGTTNSLGGWIKIGEKNSRANLEFIMPRIGSTHFTRFSRLFYDQRDIETRQLPLPEHSGRIEPESNGRYGIQRYGFTTAFGTRIQKNGQLVVDMTLQNALSYPQDRSVSSLTTGNMNMASFGTQFTLDSRNSSYLPTEGRFINFRYTFTPKFFNNDNFFWQVIASHEENIRLGERVTAQLSALLGLSNSYMPLTEKFFLGGTGNSYSYRFVGLKENDLIGNNLAVAGAQLRYKSPFDLIFPVSFQLSYNVGNVWELRDQISTEKLNHGIGAGLIWETPVGPATITVAKAFPFDDDANDEVSDVNFTETVLYFSLGYDF